MESSWQRMKRREKEVREFLLIVHEERRQERIQEGWACLRQALEWDEAWYLSDCIEDLKEEGVDPKNGAGL